MVWGPRYDRWRQRNLETEVLAVDTVEATAIEPDIGDAVEPTRAEVPGAVGLGLLDSDLASIGSEPDVGLAVELVGVVEIPAVGEVDSCAAGSKAGEPISADHTADELPIGVEINARSKRKLDHSGNYELGMMNYELLSASLRSLVSSSGSVVGILQAKSRQT